MTQKTAFQATVEAHVDAILRKHGLECAFRCSGYVRKAPWFSTTFSWKGQDHEVEMYSDTAVMLVGKSLFEVYLPAEFENDRAYAAGFAQRLDRYLSGGGWAGPDEEGPVARALRKLWSRFKS